MADDWASGWGWGDPNGHLRVSGRRLLEWADQVGWALYAEERSALQRAADYEVYIDLPLDELDVVSFGAAVDKLRSRYRVRNPDKEHTAPQVNPDSGKKKPKREKKKDDQRGRRWR